MQDGATGGTWDYVVVGGGTAGCVLANRLTEDPGTSVLLLEAGADARPLPVRVPALIQKIGSELNWLYPVDADASRHGRVDPYSSGRCIGGSSAINAMMWVRGNPADFDGWKAAGCDGWGWDDVLPAFRRSERFEYAGAPLRGGSGPQRVAFTRVSHPLIGAFIDAAVQTGLPHLSDYNGPSQLGAGLSQVTQVRGMRQSAADAYLSPARSRPGLRVRAGAQAARIVLDQGRATGVEFRADGISRVARARREVLVCAGAIGSPTLLLRSGIGPAEDLRALGIAVAADLPGVGANLHDHPAAALVFEVRGRTLNQDVTPARLLRHAADFALRGRGAITSTSNHAVVFDRLDPSSPVPQAELIFMAFGLAAAGEDDAPGDEGAGGTLRRFTARSGGSESGRRQAAAAPLVTAQAALLQPHSRGRLSITSADPHDPPRISFDLLGDDRDVAGLTAAARRIRRLFEAPALARRVVSERTPGAATDDDGAWDSYIRESAFRLYHPVGTCAMGTGTDAVVSPALKVHGVEGLRVIDASVMPVITTGNTMAPTIMIAERGSDLVRGPN